MDQRDDIAKLLALDAGALRDAHRIFGDLRAGAPVRHIPENGCYAVTRYEDIVTVLRDPARFSSRSSTGPAASGELAERIAADASGSAELLGLFAGATHRFRGRLTEDRAARLAAVLTRALMPYREVLLSADPPVHSRHRQAVTYAFSPKRVAAMTPKIEAIAHRLIDGFAGDGATELVDAYTDRLPLLVIAGALGVEEEVLPDFRRWSNQMISVVGNPAVTKEDIAGYLKVLAEFREYFTAVIADRRAAPRDDLITDVATSRVEAGLLDPDEILPMLQQFLVAGNETTGKLISATLRFLLTEPGQLASVRAEPDRTAETVDEVLRLHTPVLGLYRQANQDTEIGGCPVPAGSHLWVLYPSGNRDERQFEDPGEFRLGRANGRKHLAFGHGPHYCVGAHLARAEAVLAVNTILARLPGLRLAGGEEPVYARSHVLHGLAELPVRWEVSSGG